MMKAKTHALILWMSLLFLMPFVNVGCRYIAGYDKVSIPPVLPYNCSAEIYRELPPGSFYFTEQFSTYLWTDVPVGDVAAVCADKIDTYIDETMAPGYNWKKQEIQVTSVGYGLSGSDCQDTEPYPPIYGGPWGSVIHWEDPDGDGPAEIPQDRAYAWVEFEDVDGNIHTAEPYVAHSVIMLAERTGIKNTDGIYDPSLRHIRLSHMELNLKEFDLAGVRVTDFHIHNIGMVATNSYGTNASIEPYSAKMYLYARGEKYGESESNRFCFVNTRWAQIGYGVYPSYFLFNLDTTIDINGLPLHIKLRLISPTSTPFALHQPYVSLPAAENWVETSPVDLSPSFRYDYDSDLGRVLWFENFEQPDELFLGEGVELPDYPFPLGEHEITVVAYDSQGAYYTDTSNLTIVPPPIVINAPNGGECWDAGSRHLILWNPGEVIGPLQMLVSYDGYTPLYWQFVTNETENDGSFSWRVPYHLTNNAVLQICDASMISCGLSSSPFTIAPPDDCINAISISNGRHFGTLECASNDGAASCGLSNDQPDVWYRYTPQAPGKLSVSTCGTNDMDGIDTGIDTVISMHGDCSNIAGSELSGSCNDDWNIGRLRACEGIDLGDARDAGADISVTTGETIFIRVSKHPDSEPGEFYLNVNLDVRSCPADLDFDYDVDGRDLYLLSVNPNLIELDDFAMDYGTTGCP
jgi:hypothetical protein